VKNVIIALLFFLLCSSVLVAQDIVIIKHANYTSHFSKSKHIPVLVEYTLTSSMFSCNNNISRKGKRFQPDPDLRQATDLQKDYLHSGFDRGHNMSAENNSCLDEAMNECFYFSNVFPQVHSFNAGNWEELENKERKVAKAYGRIKVFVGNFGIQGKIGEDSVVVPMYCWKVIYIPSIDNYDCYVFPNTYRPDINIECYRTTLEIIQRKSGIYLSKKSENELNFSK